MSRKPLKGIVVSDSRDKTITVEVPRVVKHKRYHKIIKLSTKYSVHDEDNKYKVGQEVLIVESRPISKTKSWIVAE